MTSKLDLKKPEPQILTERQRRFVSEYVILGNATQAAKNAGYSEKTCYKQGSAILKRDYIREAIEEERKEQVIKNDVTMQEIITMHREAYRIGKECKAPNAMTAAAQNLAKLLGMIVEKGQLEHSGGLVVNITTFSDDDS